MKNVFVEDLSKKIVLNNNYEIREFITNKGYVKMLFHNFCAQSFMFSDEKRVNELAINYAKLFDIPVSLNPNGKYLLMLGGAGFSYPRYYLTHYLDKCADVVEIDKNSIDIAKKYFYLEDLIKFSKDRLNIINDDALLYIKTTNKKYDYIFVDLFNGRLPVYEMYTKENLKTIKNLLNENGVILINYVYLKDKDINELEYIDNMREITKYSQLISHPDNSFKNNIGNILIVLSDNKIDISIDFDFIDLKF